MDSVHFDVSFWELSWKICEIGIGCTTNAPAIPTRRGPGISRLECLCPQPHDLGKGSKGEGAKWEKKSYKFLTFS